MYMYTTTFQFRFAVTSVWKAQHQQFEHFSVANNELFHVACSTQNNFLLKIGHFLGMIKKNGQI